MSELVNPGWPDGLIESPREDRRNVIDHYKYWDEDAIRKDVNTKRTELHVVCENFASILISQR